MVIGGLIGVEAPPLCGNSKLKAVVGVAFEFLTHGNSQGSWLVAHGSGQPSACDCPLFIVLSIRICKVGIVRA